MKSRIKFEKSDDMGGYAGGLRFFLLLAFICFVSESSLNRMLGQTHVEAGLSAVALGQNAGNEAYSLSTLSTERSKVSEANQNPVASASPVTTPENTPVNGMVTATDADGDVLTFSKVSDPAHGSVVVNTDGTYTYTPNVDYTGTDSFTVRATDSNGGYGDVTVNVTITPNHVPTITLKQTTMEDSPIYDSVSASDDDGDTMTFSKGISPVHGTLIVNSDGAYLYTPDKDFNGKDSFTITVNDGKGGITTVKIIVTVLPVNDDPVAVATPVTTQEDTPVNGSVTATDVDGDVLTITKDSDPIHGSVVFNPDGTYTYTPAQDYHGDDSFMVSVSDGNGGTATATVTITITSVNDDPVIAATPVTTTEDTPVSGNATATDVDGDALTFSKGSDPAHGTVDVLADGTYTYTPAKDYNGDDSFTVSVSDGNGGIATATVAITVTPVNDDPVITATPVTTLEDTSVNGSATATDVDGDALTFSKVSDPSHGTVDVNPDGTYNYIPAKDYNGDDSFQISVSDGNGGVATATVTITITPVNDAPVLTATPVTTQEDTPVNGSVTATDVDGDVLTITKDSDPIHGSVVFNFDGTYTYTPAKDYHGDDSFTVSVSDGNGGTATATVSITVTPVNDDPVITATPITTPEDTPVNGTATATDVDGDVLTFSVGTTPSHGIVDVHSDGSYTYTPAKDYNGDDSFTISVSDGNGGTASATVTVTITPVNDDPVTTPLSVSTPEDTSLVSSVMAGATDVDGDVLTVTGFSMDGTDYLPGTTVVIPGKGTFILNANGDYTLIPNKDYNGSVPSVTYTVTDGNGGTATGVINLTVIAVNDDPVITATPITTPEDTPVNGNATASDVDGDVLTFAVGTAPAHGTVDVHSDGSYTYTPAKDYNGDDGFTISVSDGNGGTASATVTVTITPVNDDPVLTATPVTTQEDIPANGNVTATDVDGDALTFSKDSDPLHGTVVFNSDGTYTYTPAKDYHGDDSFTVSVSDGNGGTAAATVLITVTPVNDDPVITATPITTPEDTPVNGNVTATDVDGDVLTFAVGTAPAHGTVDVHSDGSYTYTPAKDYNGDDSFTVSVSDGNGGTASATVTVTITPVNDDPVLTATPVTTQEDIPANGNVTATDVDGDALTFSKDSDPLHGTVDVNADGSYTYTPAKDYHGDDSFSVSVSDGNGGTATATVLITVTPVNDDPVITATPVTTPEDTPVNGNATATDVDGDVLTFAVGTAPAHGTVDVHSDGSYTYTPAKDYNGDDSFTISVSDGNGGTASATVTVAITPVNDAPVTTPLLVSTPEDTPLTSNVLAGATDVDGDVLTVTGFTMDGTNYLPGTIAVVPGKGTFILNANGNYTLIPDKDYNGSVPSVTYTVTDGNGGTATGVITITVIAVNDDPVIAAAPVTTPEDTPVNGTATATDVDGDVLTFAVGTVPSHGTVDVHSDGSYAYTPAKDYNGDDSFTISVSDGNGGVVIATVTVTITPVNDIPVATDDAVSVVECTSVSGTVAGNDTPSGDGGNIWSVKDNPSHGTVTLNADGTYIYIPTPNYHGTDAFTYTLTDVDGDQSTATLTVTVTPLSEKLLIIKQSTKPQQTSDGSFIWKYTISLTNLQNVRMDNIQVEDDLAKVFTHGESFKVTNITASGNLKANGLYDGLNATSTLLSGSYLSPLSKDSVVMEVQVYSHDYIGNEYNQVLFEGFSIGTGQIRDALSDDPNNKETGQNSPRATITFVPEVELHIPGGFSPNQDTYNDAFEIVHSGNITLSIEVYNRWGTRVYRNTDYRDDWDGKGVDNLLGKDLPGGTYFYIIITTNKKTSEVKKITGSLTLRR